MTELNEGVLVADGHTLARGGMMSILTTEFSLPAVIGVGDFEAMARALSHHPGIGLLLLDSALPGMGGMQGLRRYRLERPDLRVVLMSANESRADAFEALAAGAHGYLPKELAAEDMVQALRAVLSGQIYVPAIISDLSLGGAHSTGDGAGRMAPELTTRQREVLTHLAAGLSNKEIARALNIAEGTVKVHITAAFRILHVHNRVGAAAAMQRLGRSDRREQPELPGMDGEFPHPFKTDFGAKALLACLPLWLEGPWMAGLEALI